MKTQKATIVWKTDLDTFLTKDKRAFYYLITYFCSEDFDPRYALVTEAYFDKRQNRNYWTNGREKFENVIAYANLPIPYNPE
jgi:hypothetical protein